MSNQSQGAVLAGQPVAVTAGSGITIDPSTGVISVNAATITGVMKLNNGSAYNAYQWPNGPGTNGQFLQTNGAGLVDWADVQGFAVVTVGNAPPTPPTVGELWFDCLNGTLNVYQNCVGTPSPNWFNVSQPGLPVLPGSTSAAPPFVSGSGTSAAPYVCNTTTVPVSGSAVVVNTVSVVGLAPFQYVPIADLNGVANGGRFSFSNYYADATGTLTFQTIFNDVPGSPVGTLYTANIKIGYGSAYVDAVITIVAALTLAPGTITGTPTVGTAVSYTPGVASGGTSPYTYTYQWLRDGVAIGGATSSSYTPVAADVGKTLSVTQTVTDFALATASATTTASGVTVYASIPSGTWNPGNTMNTSVPGTSSATWNGATGTVTSSGCVVLSTTSATGPWSTSVTATNGQPLYVQWDMAAAGTCGDAATGTLIQGTVTSAVGQNSYSVTVNRKPSPALPNVSDSNVALGATVSKTLGTTVQGINATAYITLGAASTGTNVKVSLDGGTTFVTVPSAPSTSMPVTLGQTIIIEQTVGSSTTVGYTAIINVGDSTGSTGAASTYQTVTYTATTVTSAAFPNTTFTPSTGPNATPAATNILGDPLGNLVGTASTTNWNDGSPTLTATNMLMSIGAAVAPTLTTISPTPGNTVNIAYLPSYIATLAHNAFATGSFTDGTTYTNTYTYQVKKQPANWTLAPITGAATSTQQTTGPFTPDSYNSPVTVSFSAPTTGGATTMANVIAEVNGVATPITVGTTTVTLNPGDQLEILGDSDSTGGVTTGVTVTLGAATAQEWLVTTTAVTNAITAPTMLPSGTGINPALNSPAGITLDGGTYTVASGAPGPHTSSDWELYSGSYPLTSTNNISTVAQNAAGAWTARASGTINGIRGVAYGNSLFAAVGGSYISTSPDGSVWTSAGTISDALNSVIYANGRFVAVGAIGGTSSGVAYTSLTGATWTPGSTGATQILNGIAYGNSSFVAVGNSGVIQTSANGTSWNSQTSGTSNGLSDVTYGNSLFVAVGVSGTILTSSNGTAWSPQVSGTTQTLYSVVYNNSLFVAVGDNGTILTSSNGTSWAPQTSGTTESLRGVFYNGSQFVSLGTNGAIFTSSNGSSWLSNSLTTAQFFDAGATGEGVSVIVGSGGLIYTSSVPSTTLTIAGCQTDGFQVGDTIVSLPSGAGPATITAVDNSNVTVVPSSALWTTQKITRATSMYTQVVPPPANPNSANLETLFIAQASLTPSTTYWSRARYSASSTSTTSPWATWTSFTTASAFVIPPGTAMGGGYFGGQINDGGTIYNLIVAPLTSGSLTGFVQGQYKNANTADIPSLLVQTVAYGGSTSDLFDTDGGTHPVFNWLSSPTGPNGGPLNIATGGAGGGTGFGGFTDWYIPAKNELEIIYRTLKPTLTSNITSSGANANAVPSATSNYTAGDPARTTSSLFQSGGAQAFDTSNPYWTTSQDAAGPNAFTQNFNDGTQTVSGKANINNTRAIRRVAG